MFGTGQILPGDVYKRQMVMGRNGDPEMISGLKELIQRVMLRLSVKRGGFPYNQQLGSRLAQLDLNQTDEFTLLAAVREALADLEEVTVSGIEKTLDRETQTLYLTVYLVVNGREAIVELNDQLW